MPGRVELAEQAEPVGQILHGIEVVARELFEAGGGSRPYSGAVVIFYTGFDLRGGRSPRYAFGAHDFGATFEGASV